ncbi:S-adenosyl-L-methionine-dependent methyltransferase [Trametes punicea]|nr:S-adenosyl-L-methionine-dependent methyltransferase [Trametes punicea]
MTFAALRSLHALIGEALDDIERIYQDASFDPPSSTPTTPYNVLASPCTPYRRRPTHMDEDADEEDYPRLSMGQAPKTPSRGPGGLPGLSVDLRMLDLPPLDTPYYPTEDHTLEADAAESLASHPDVIAAANRIVAACGQISATIHRPFLTLCDAAMGYHLPACLRFLEASHTVEILRAAGPDGMHVRELSRHLDVDEGKLSHILRLLATHHITREVRPNVFANNRISAIIDSGWSPADLRRSPQDKYENTNGIAAFINLCTDELFKSSAYLVDCYLPSLSKKTEKEHPMHAPFNVAFGTTTPYFEWLEKPGNEMRLRRFGPAMTGTAAWEVPGAIISAFPWIELPEGALVVDVGGGIGSTSMLLAHTFPHLRFIVQDRPQVVEHGVTAWRERCPEMLDSGRAAFLGHDFFLPQPPLSLQGSPTPVTPTVYLMRVITHDWPDQFVTKILLNLRMAAGPDTKLLLADHILPLACVDEDIDDPHVSQSLPGAIRSLAPEGSPLLPNLGKANANAYWMDMTMRATFNAQERTLREMAALTLTAGWKIVDVVHAEGSLFGHMTAVPVEIPAESLTLLESAIPAADAYPPGQDPPARARSASVTSASGTVRMDKEAIRKPNRKDRRPLIAWWRGRKDSQTSKNARAITPEEKGRPKLAIVTSPAPEPLPHTSFRSQPFRTASMVRIAAPDSDATAVSSPETTPDSAKGAHHTILQSALVPAPDGPMLLPALEPASPVKLRSAPSRTSLRKKASQVFEFSKASVASLRSAALGVASPSQVPPVPPLPSVSPECSSWSSRLESLKMMRSQSHLGLARVTIEARSGRAMQEGSVESGLGRKSEEIKMRTVLV